MTRPAHPASSVADARLTGFLAHLEQERRLSPHTVENYGRDVRMLLELNASAPLQDLRVHQIRRFVARLHARGLSGRSLARVLSAWRSFFHYLAREHGVGSIAFPALGTGNYGWPRGFACGIAIAACEQALQEAPSIKRVIFCCFTESDAQIYRTALA